MGLIYEYLVNTFKTDYCIKIEQSFEQFPNGDLPVIYIESKNTMNQTILNKVVIPNINRLAEGWEKAFEVAFKLIK